MTTGASIELIDESISTNHRSAVLLTAKPPSVIHELECLSTRWLERRNSKTNRFVLELRRHVEDQSVNFARLLQSATKAGAKWFDSYR